MFETVKPSRRPCPNVYFYTPRARFGGSKERFIRRGSEKMFESFFPAPQAVPDGVCLYAEGAERK